jgi:dipeptide transport system ATP-binding protein
LRLISHDLAVVAQSVSRVAVLYAGQVMEEGPVPAIFASPRHPYTRALIDALPEHNIGRARLAALPGAVPGAGMRPPGCLLAPRCPRVRERCRGEGPPPLRTGASVVRCFFPLEPADARGEAARA